MMTAIIAAKTNDYKYNRFRQSFHLNFSEKQYIKEQGYYEIEKYAQNIIKNRIKLKPNNDGKQTPNNGHPIFKAQHATACCCRKCIQKHHQIPSYKTLSDEEVNHLVNTVMMWIRKEMKGIA